MALLPFLEQKPLYDQINDKDIGPGSYESLAVQLPIALCPSDPELGNTGTYGWCNYHVSSGSWVGFLRTAPSGQIMIWDGAFGYDQDIVVGGNTVKAIAGRKLAAIQDGQTNTVMFAEVQNGSGDSGNEAENTDCYAGGISSSSFTSGSGASVGSSWSSARSAFNNTVSGTTPVFPYRGCNWMYGNPEYTWCNLLLPPNKPCWMPNGYSSGSTDTAAMVSPASSGHTDGVNVAMCGGNVLFVSQEVDQDVWTALGTVNGGKYEHALTGGQMP